MDGGVAMSFCGDQRSCIFVCRLLWRSGANGDKVGQVSELASASAWRRPDDVQTEHAFSVVPQTSGGVA